MYAQYAFDFYQNLREQRPRSTCLLKAEKYPQAARRKNRYVGMNKSKNINEDRIGKEKLLFGLKVTGKFVQISETIFCAQKPQTS